MSETPLPMTTGLSDGPDLWAGVGTDRVRLPAGHAASSRILWEHTRGRYSCMQCTFSTASRPTMTLHLEDHRSIAPGQPRPDCPVGKVGEHQGGEGGGPRGEGWS